MADPESTNACPTSPTTDIQPELLPCPFCGDADIRCGSEPDVDGNPDSWFVTTCDTCGAELCGSTQAQANARWNTRLTSTTPTLGDMVNEDDYDFTAGCPGYGAKNTRCSRPLGHEGGCHIFACLEVLEGVDEAEAAPATTIPTSVANEGEREAFAALKRTPAIEALTPSHDEWMQCESVQDRYDLMKRCVDRAAALSPALDNTAVEGARTLAEGMREAFEKLSTSTRYELGDRLHWAASRDDADEIVKLLTPPAVQTEKA